MLNFLSQVNRYSKSLKLFLIIIIAIGIIRISLTYNIFSHTNDEPAHIAAGMEWLAKGVYQYEPQHPPLARIAVALFPYLDGQRSKNYENMYDEGKEILHDKDRYFHNLTLARIGTLIFFILASYAVWVWGCRIYDPITALFAVFLFTSLPVTLAHSGLATTDMAVTATITAALISLQMWLLEPNIKHSLLLGVTGALAILSKFSALLFLGVGGFVLIALHLIVVLREKRELPFNKLVFMKNIGAVIFTGFIVIWACYHFTTAQIQPGVPHIKIDRIVGAEGIMHDFAYAIAESVIIPAPEFIQGIQDVFKHNKAGHTAYLLGEISEKGWWYFFPVVLIVKTPLPFLLLSFFGIYLLVKQSRASGKPYMLGPPLVALAILLSCMPFNINIGIRHVLPMFPLLSISAGFALAYAWRKKGQIAYIFLFGTLIIWHIISTVAVHPDYLAYFNEIAGEHPEEIIVDSDLDWGQDIHRLSTKLKSMNIKTIKASVAVSGELARKGISVQELSPYEPDSGWVAVSMSHLKYAGSWDPSWDGRLWYQWLENYKPMYKVGKSIRLYYINVEDGRVHKSK